MSNHISATTLQCQMPGCLGPRWPNSTLCSRHWRRLTLEERRDLTTAVMTAGAAAIAGDQEALDEALRGIDALLERVVLEMPTRAEIPTAGRREVAF
jgi:hypothetical protein